MRLRTWLKQTACHSVRVRVGNEDHAVKVDHDDQRRWARTEDTILSMGATKVHALAKDGSVIRAMDLEVVKEREEEARASGKAPIGEENELAQLARVLNEAHDNAAKRHEGAYLQGFSMLVGLTQKAVDATLELSKANERLNRRLETLEVAAATGSTEDELPNMFMQGMLARMGFAPKPGAAAASGNGEGAPDGMAQFAAALASAAQAQEKKNGGSTVIVKPAPAKPATNGKK